MVCTGCGVENPPGSKFCHECGSPLTRSCSGCGAAVLPAAKFCHECGSTLAGTGQGAADGLGSPLQVSDRPTELRHVSVLFCDLVGFTTFSERRDPEEVRELLSGYFELARAIVARYGGIVEKFIGDAVMAVWGAPVAKEDDAERAVRAGLELVSAVAAYGSEHGTALQARVGGVTGGAATTTAEEGIVIGDRVNTAARIQSASPPGCCYVDETTRAATAAAIAYSDAGVHELKGKAEPVHLYQATQVVAAIAGSQRSGVIEAPFIGRDHELRLVKELFHAAAERRSARLVLVSGVAGVGKSRLAWEFFKYIDGLAGDVLWHAGRCLSYGEGVSYWALSEMVRARLQISEDDPLDVVAERLRTGLERWIPDATDREFIAPRLGQLLGLPSNQVLAKEELFSGWRLFFERLAEFLPVLLVVEDLQWADAGLVDFLDHLLEWSGDHAIFLLVLSRPDGVDRGRLMLSRRSVTTIPLDPLSDEVMGRLLDGLVTDLPATARARIVERAEGIPLYGIETVRALLDKGSLAKGDDGLLHLVGELGALEIPPGLTALIASRLDVLGGDERRLVKECSVLGTSFPRQAIEAVTELDPADLDELLSSLVRKEVLTVRADKLSPERGQYAFTQSLIRSVAYDMLTRTERKARHLRTAAHMRSAFPDEGAEVAEVIGAHLFDAYRAAGEDPDAEELRTQACAAYTRAAERAASVGALESAEAAYLKAADLSTDAMAKARFTEQGGRMAADAGWHERAGSLFENAIAAHAAAGRAVDVARVTCHLAEVLDALGRGESAIAHLREAIASLEGHEAPPEVMASLHQRLAGALLFAGHVAEADTAAETALTLAQHHELALPLARSLNVKGIMLSTAARAVEARMFFEQMLEVARENGLSAAEATAENNLADLCMTRDLPGAEDHARAAVVLARRLGRRSDEAWSTANLIYVLSMVGRLDEAAQLGSELLQSGGAAERPGLASLGYALACVDVQRGNLAAAREHAALCRAWQTSDDVQQRAMYLVAEAAVCQLEGDLKAALEQARLGLEVALAGGLGVASEAFRNGFSILVESALGLDELDPADKVVSMLRARPRGEVPAYLKAQLTRAQALLSAARGDETGLDEQLEDSRQLFAELGYPYWAARAQLDRALALAARGRSEESAGLALAACAVFEQLGCASMASRAKGLAEAAVARPSGVVALQPSG